jgi:hypothetical protein
MRVDCDALCLRFSLLGLGARVGLAALLVAYTAGAIASQIPGLPAGVGMVGARRRHPPHHEQPNSTATPDTPNAVRWR